MLAAWRAAQDPPLTQADAAEMFGVAQSSYSSWEGDIHVPASQAQRVALLKRAGVPLDAWVSK
jgi:transcriptional regulator with XRE-family HTH domain